MKQIFSVSGADSKKVLKTAAGRLEALDGVKKARAHFRVRRISVRFQPDKISARDLISALEDCGLNARAYVNPAGARFLLRLWVSVLLCLITMYLSYATAWHLPLPEAFSYPLSAGITQLILMVPVWLLCSDVLKSKLFEVRSRTPGLYTLALLGSLACAFYSVPALVAGAYHVSAGHSYKLQLYFDCASFIPTMVYLGQALEFSAHRRNEAAFLKYVGSLPEEDVGLTRTRAMRRVTRLTNICMPLILLLSLGTAVYWYAAGESVGFSVHTAVCILVISCPCAPGLAVPAVMMNGMTRASQAGVPVRSAPTLETLSHTDTVIIYDPHMSTRSHARVEGCVLTPGMTENLLLSLAASAMQSGESAYCRAVTEYAEHRRLPLDPVSDFEETDGGVRARVGDSYVLAGTCDFLQKNALNVEGWTEKKDALADEGYTCIFVAVSGRIPGIITLKEALDEEVRHALKDLSSLGIRAKLLTPTRPRAAEVAILQAGFDAVVHPEDADMTLRILKADKRRILGVYDTPKCPELFSGLPLTLARQDASVTCERADAAHAYTAVKTARDSIRLLRRDLLIWLIFDLVGIPIAAGILYRPLGFALSPVLATPLMLKVCTLMVTNRIKKDKPAKEQSHKK